MSAETTPPLPAKIRRRIQVKLERAAQALEDALDLARENGWPSAEGFISGEGYGVCLHVCPEEPDNTDHHTIKANADGVWGCGGW